MFDRAFGDSFARMEQKQALDMWVIYDHPKDFPDSFVARRWEVTNQEKPTADYYAAPTRAEVEALLPPGLHFAPRFEQDDLTIVGVWF